MSLFFQQQSLFVKNLDQTTVHDHLSRDVPPADEFSVDVKLRIRRPLRIRFQTLADFFVFHDVDEFVLDGKLSEKFDDANSKSATGMIRSAGEEDDDSGLVDEAVEFFVKRIVVESSLRRRRKSKRFCRCCGCSRCVHDGGEGAGRFVERREENHR